MLAYTLYGQKVQNMWVSVEIVLSTAVSMVNNKLSSSNKCASSEVKQFYLL